MRRLEMSFAEHDGTECLQTKCTLERLDSAVRQHVAQQRSVSRERRRTFRAVIILVTRVRSHVCLQHAIRREQSTAVVASVWLLT